MSDDTTREKVLHHVARTPLPWRDGPGLTECGRPTAEMKAVWTRDEAVAKSREMGAQRFSLFVCMTCRNTANSWPTWDENPAQRLGREGLTSFRQYDDPQLERELRALAALAEAHRDEFMAMVEGLAETTDLNALRAKKR